MRSPSTGLHMEDDQKHPIDYRNPQTPRPPPIARNFALGFVSAIVGLAICSFLAGQRELGPYVSAGAAGLAAIGAIATALASLRHPHYRGYAQGFLVAIGLVVLTFCGLCFYAFKNI